MPIKRKKCSDFLYHLSLKAELSRLWEQLDHITAVVQGQTPGSSPSHDGRQDCFTLTAPGASLAFPFMVMQSEAFMNLLGLEKSLPVLLEHIERGRKAIPAQSYGAKIVMADLQEASMYVNTSCECVSLPFRRRGSDISFTFL
jgi:hypothetical protein